MPGKQARALCPVCQEPLPPDETECENCGAFVIDEAVVRLSRAFGLDRERALQLVDAGFRHPRQLHDRDVDGVIERRESGLLFICTNCGSFVAGKDNRCARCHVEFEAEEEPAAPEAADILDLVLCPTCGADNTPDWEECEICGEPLPGRVRPRGPPNVSRPDPPRSREPDAGVDEDSRMLNDLDALLATDLELEAEPGPEVHAGDPVRTPPRPSAQASQDSVKPVRSPRAPETTPTPPVPVDAQRNVVRTSGSVRLVRRASDHRSRRGRRRGKGRPTGEPPREGLPADPAAPGVLAAAGALLMVPTLGDGEAIAWGVAVALGILVAYRFFVSARSLIARAWSMDGGLLLAGTVLGVVAPGVFSGSPEAGTLLAALAAVPLALAARRLQRTSDRAFLSLAAGLVLIALAHAAATSAPMSLAPAWVVGIVAAGTWPAIVVLTDMRGAITSRRVGRHLLEAERGIARRDFTASADAYDRAITIADRTATGGDLPWYGKGATLVMLGRYEEALRAIDHALDINPRNEVAWLNKGNAFAKLGRHADALRCFNAAIKVNPDYEVAWNNKGNALARLGRLEEALRCYERALGVDPGYRGAWVNKGYVLAKLGRFDEAASCADRVLTLRDRARLEPA